MSKAASIATAPGASAMGSFGGSLGNAFKNKLQTQMLSNNVSKKSSVIDVSAFPNALSDVQEQENQGGRTPAGSGNLINEKNAKKSIIKQNEFDEDDFEAELRKLQELDENRVAMGHKGLTDEERAKTRLTRARTRKSVLMSKSTPNENTPKGGGVTND